VCAQARRDCHASCLARGYASFGRDVLWSHPAFANRSVYVRNDKEIICVSLESK
jgi:hypothetical protein